MSIYGALYGSPLDPSQLQGLFPSQSDPRYGQWVNQTQAAAFNQAAADYARYRLVHEIDRLANIVPPWTIEAERARYRAKADAAGGDRAYSRQLDGRISAARAALRAP